MIMEVQQVFVCQASFKNSKFDNKQAGTGFFIRFNKKVYGVTAKHVLLFTKTDKMNCVHFGEELIKFEFVSRKDASLRITASRLVNENSDEKIELPFHGDWLIFEILQELPESIFVFSLSENVLKQGDPLSFQGFPYQTEDPTLPIKVHGDYLEKMDSLRFRMKVPNGNYTGCSGGPIVDATNRLVGIVSSGYVDQHTNEMMLESASIQYFKKMLDESKE